MAFVIATSRKVNKIGGLRVGGSTQPGARHASPQPVSIAPSSRCAAARKRAAYKRTIRELRGIPLHLTEDLGIYPGDERRLARQAIYG